MWALADPPGGSARSLALSHAHCADQEARAWGGSRLPALHTRKSQAGLDAEAQALSYCVGESEPGRTQMHPHGVMVRGGATFPGQHQPMP